MIVNLEKPVVWTCKGNVNADQLDYAVTWEHQPDMSVSMVETYRFKSDGEIARQSKHVLSLKGVELSGQQAA